MSSIDKNFDKLREKIKKGRGRISNTGYDEFCQAGIDWDIKFQELGATKVTELQKCDVDFSNVSRQQASHALRRYCKAWLNCLSMS